MAEKTPRTLIAEMPAQPESCVTVRGWITQLRVLAKNTFIVLRDCSGEVQCVADTTLVRSIDVKKEDAVEVVGLLKSDPRSRSGIEILVERLTVLNSASGILPFTSTSDCSNVGLETVIEYRPLSLRTQLYSDIFRVQAAVLQSFRDYLRLQHFTEIVTSKIVGGGTEGGSNLFEIKYFDRVAYLAQSPQFYKEECVVGFDRVFETGHVYRAEPHASSRHLTEYYSLDFEMGFIDGPEDVIEMERCLLNYIFQQLNETFSEVLIRYRGALLPVMDNVPVWEFDRCLEILRERFGREDLFDDLDPEGERQICSVAEEETGVAAVFVLGFPLASRPFYTHPRGTGGAAQSFDLLFEGLEITTGGQRLYTRTDLENALSGRGIDPRNFESHIRSFDLGMPPHGGLAIGLERLTAQILRRSNVRDATLYPRDRYRIVP